ncbi:hypothetical protein D9M68_859880 [compost metagenome]
MELKLQACIFQYDICSAMVGFLRNKPTGFSARVALKDLVLHLYEYDNLMNTTLIPRLIDLATSRGVSFDKATVKNARAQRKIALNRLKQWSDVRNQAAGHYGKDLNVQITLLKKLDPDEVMEVTQAFLSFNKSILEGLRDAGQGVKSDA